MVYQAAADTHNAATGKSLSWSTCQSKLTVIGNGNTLHEREILHSFISFFQCKQHLNQPNAMHYLKRVQIFNNVQNALNNTDLCLRLGAPLPA